MKKFTVRSGWVAAAFAFAAAFVFFQFIYPYHLIRREQLTFFMYDSAYLSAQYSGAGWFARLAGDFLDQFFGIKVAGPVIVALLLTASAAVAYRIMRFFSGKAVSVSVAALLYVWFFMRETENQFCTQYTVAALGYLLLVLLAFKICSGWRRAVSVVLCLSLGFWLLGSPYHKYYGRLWGRPEMLNEKIIALDIEAFEENWDKVLELSKKYKLNYNEASYFYNLAGAMKGSLGDNLLKYPQNYTNSLFLWVSDKYSPFVNSVAGEVWFHLGDMTLAEQSIMVALQASPKHNGARYLKRLALINLISGQYGAARKYLNMLDKTLFYHRWAHAMMPENHSAGVSESLASARSRLASSDIISYSNDIRPILLGLLDADPGNTMAREYLLCYDLMGRDIDTFAEDYRIYPAEGSIYEEAMLIWLNLQNDNDISGVDTKSYGIGDETVDRLNRFYRNPNIFRSTFWYFYLNEMGK